MKLATLWAFRVTDLANPIRDPHGTKGLGWTGEGTLRHVGAHLVGGAAWFGLFALLGAPQPVLCAIAAAGIRQDWLMEVPACAVPLWSALWDVGTTAVAAGVTKLLVGLVA